MGQASKLKEGICNVKVDVVNNFNILPLFADTNGIVIVKKSEYRSHVYFVSVRLRFIFRLVQFPQMNNPLYYDAKKDLSNVSDYFIKGNENKIFQSDNSYNSDTLFVDALENS